MMTFPAEPIEAAFRQNFAEKGELGAGLSVWEGETEVVSVTGGFTTRDRDLAWHRDTLVPVWSATKGPAAVATLLALHENGFPLHAPVAELWPELRAARDSALSFAAMIGHQAGLPALAAKSTPPIFQHSELASALEAQEPFWEPGRGHGYHARTIGVLMDEIVRRATGGMTLGRFWRDRVADPLGIDVYIGSLKPTELDRIATIYPPRILSPAEEERPFYRSLRETGSLAQLAFSTPRGLPRIGDINRTEFLLAGLPALGGVATASGLGKFYAVLANGGVWRGVRRFPEEIVSLLSQPLSSGKDQVLLLPTAFSAGFMLDPSASHGEGKLRSLFGPSPRAFGQPGAGGSHAFADPDRGVAFAYVMNQMEGGILPNDKSLDLVRILYS